MASMSDNCKCSSRGFGDNSQLINCILDSGAKCHMTPHFLGFIPGLLEDMDKHIEVADGHHVIAKQKGQVQIKMCDNNKDSCFCYVPENEIKGVIFVWALSSASYIIAHIFIQSVHRLVLFSHTGYPYI